ncbi:serine-rich adhesin for platelets [Drosophila kikkawai]|uniref:Serine-rich adhesin for platelets n=1 Tax=Drosophila kikkawai TaxID=30033 RepID=A0A6P4J506_DROKI
MKGQLDKQQQQARLAAIARSQENVSAEDEQLIFNSDSEQDERITYWTRQQLEKRTKELNLAKENGGLSAKPNFGGKRLSGVEELSMSATSDIYSTSDAEAVTSVISQSHSTTSDSQITVRSSPIVLDKLAVCRHCHKNCQQSGPGGNNRGTGTPGGATSSNPVLLCNSLKVQHSQSSPNRCCKLNGTLSSDGLALEMGLRTGTTTTTAGAGSMTSMSSSSTTTTTTITGELSSKRVAGSSSTRRETGDTESDVAQLITDELSLSQSEATDDSVGAMPNSSSLSAGEVNSSKLRHLDQSVFLPASLPNGHCSKSNSNSVSGSPKPLPPPRRTRIVAQLCQEPSRPKANQQVKAIVTITETARIMRSVERSPSKSVGGGGAAIGGGSPAKYAACHCRCQPEDFTHAQLSPDKMEHQTCKLLESPKQTTSTSTIEQQKQEDEQLSLMLIGLAQFAPAARLCGGGAHQAHKPSPREDDTPTIAVVPPTPDAVLTKTSTHVWDNSGCSSSNGGGTTTTTSTATTTTKQPRQATIENIPEDSCDESPLDEEPPYRPMSSALRRFGTMSSLEKLPSDDRMDEADELDDDLEEPVSYTPNGHDEDNEEDGDGDDDEEVGSDKALAQNLNEPSTSAGMHLVNGDVLASGAWTNRAGAYVTDKMSFFEESRAFIDKYLGRWNAGDAQLQQGGGGGGGTASETDEQMDECTSGATSGEEVWGTPTSGGDNDDQDLQLINSENTHSSPTKSSTSLNDDDDTELMMDELLMAPPMTASTIRGLLPRRRLEPLFEEETESDEEKTQQDSDDVKKGEATTNGHYLEDSAGSSDDSEAAAAVPPPQPPAPPAVVPDREEDPAELKLEQEEQKEQEEYLNSRQVVPAQKEKEKVESNVMMGPRPLVTTRLLPTTAIVSEVAPLVASSCEYLLDQRPSSGSKGSPGRDRVASITMKNTTPLPPTRAMPVAMTIGTGTEIEKWMTSRTTTTMTTTTTATMTVTATTTTSMTMASRAPSSIITTTSSGSVTTNSGGRASGKPPRFVPPPPPPRRLLLTQTDLSAAPAKTEPPRRKSGAIADNGSSGAVGVAANASVPIGIGSRIMPASAPNTISSKRVPSSTIIETCLLGAPRPVSVTSLATVSRIAKTIPTAESQRERRSQVPEEEEEEQGEQEQEPSHSPAAVEPDAAGPRSVAGVQAPHAGCGLSPRLEMRLALNHDILGDEDLICYEPGPDLTTILGHDLSTFHRLTGRDLLSRSATNRVQPKEAVISYSQHRNSKMDTPTVNRRPRPLSAGAALSHSRSRSHSNTNSSSHGSPLAAGGSIRAAGEELPQPRHPHQPGHPPAGWSGGGSVGRAGGNANGSGGEGSIGSKSNRDGSKLGDLEILARREKIYSMSQSRSGCRVRETSTMSTTLVAMASEMRTEMEAMGTPMVDSTRRDSSWPTRAAAAASLTRTRSTTSMDGAGAITTTTTMTEAFLETDIGRSKRLINFIKRRNSEITASSTNSSSTPNFSDGAVQLGDQQPHPSHSQSSLLLQKLPSASGQDTAAEMAQMSPRKDNDKPSLNRRLWKQITKRRRTNSVSQIVAG